MKLKALLYPVAVLLIVSLLFMSAATSVMSQENELQPGTAMGRNDNVLIKADQSPQSDTLATLEKGNLLNVIEINGDWAQVEYEDVVGWSPANTLINVEAPMPGPLGYAEMVYDSESHRFILFGGEDFIDDPIFQNDTWAYDLDTNTWTYMKPTQAPPKAGNPMTYDVQSDRIILFVGASGWPPEDRPSETWAYDFNENTWENMGPEISPPALLGARVTYDVESDRVILFGGVDALRLGEGVFFLNETWAYDLDSNSWEEMHPAESPPGRSFFAMTYDAAGDRTILFGGGTDTDDPSPWEITSDTWAYDYNSNTWQLLELSETPMPRAYDAMIYRDASNQIILFGGANEQENEVFNDTWAYETATNTWTELAPAVSPDTRGWYAMAYSTESDKIVLFGGGPDRSHFTLETWIYDPEKNIWTMVNQ